MAEMRILFVAPKYYGYEELIRQGLCNTGAEVIYVENRSFQHDGNNRGTPWYSKVPCKKDRYISDTLIPLTRRYYDACIFINLFSFHPELMVNLKKYNANIKTTLYLWDNIQGYKWEVYFKHFQNIYTFDPADAKAFNLKYLPNFFVPYEGSLDTIKYDVSSIASFQMHRLSIMKKLAGNIKDIKRNYFFYLYLSPVYYARYFNPLKYKLAKILGSRFKNYIDLYELANNESVSFVGHSSITLHDSISILAQSKCIIDIPYHNQTGSTHRVIQALALNKKVITSNQSITCESFYNPEYITVQSTKNFSIDWKWIDRPTFSKVDVEFLRLSNWVNQLLFNNV